MYGNTLKIFRTEKELSRRDISNKLGVSYEVVKNWENNVTDIPIEMISPLCNVLECSADKFLNYNTQDFEWYCKSKDRAGKLFTFMQRSEDNERLALYIFNEFKGNPYGILVMANLFTCLPPTKRIQIATIVWESFEHQYLLDKSVMPSYAEEMYDRRNEYFKLCRELQNKTKDLNK